MKTWQVGGKEFHSSCDVREWTYNLARDEQKKYFGKCVSVDRHDKMRYGLFCNESKRWVWIPEVLET